MQKSKWIRFLTVIRRLFDKLFRSSHRTTLVKILTDHVMTKNPKRETREIYESLVKTLNDKKSSITAINKILKKTIACLNEGKFYKPSREEKSLKKELKNTQEVKHLEKLDQEDASESLWVLNQLHKHQPNESKALLSCCKFAAKALTYRNKKIFSAMIERVKKSIHSLSSESY